MLPLWRLLERLQSIHFKSGGPGFPAFANRGLRPQPLYGCLTEGQSGHPRAREPEEPRGGSSPATSRRRGDKARALSPG